jgi:hypothetical protein
MMNKDVRISLSQDDDRGVVMTVHLDNMVVFRTESLFPEDLALALFEIQRDNDRSSHSLSMASDEEVFFVLDHFFTGGLHELLSEVAVEQVWAKHVLTPRVPTTVRSSMYLVGDRFLCGRNGHFFASARTATLDAQLTLCRQTLDELITAQQGAAG